MKANFDETRRSHFKGARVESPNQALPSHGSNWIQLVDEPGACKLWASWIQQLYGTHRVALCPHVQLPVGAHGHHQRPDGVRRDLRDALGVAVQVEFEFESKF